MQKGLVKLAKKKDDLLLETHNSGKVCITPQGKEKKKGKKGKLHALSNRNQERTGGSRHFGKVITFRCPN